MLQDSWIKPLYDKPSDVDQNVAVLRKKLNIGLSSKRSHEKGDLMPYVGLAVCLRENFAFCDTQGILFMDVFIDHIVKSYTVFFVKGLCQVFYEAMYMESCSIIFKENVVSFVVIKLYRTHLFSVSRFYS